MRSKITEFEVDPLAAVIAMAAGDLWVIDEYSGELTFIDSTEPGMGMWLNIAMAVRRHLEDLHREWHGECGCDIADLIATLKGLSR